MSAQDSIPAYFLTRHHANLMQSLARITAIHGSLSVLHGGAGIGKSRLLQAFIEYHVRDRSWRLIEFLPQGLFLLKGEGVDPLPRPQHELGHILEQVAGVDLWLVDGFDLALEHGREQLYRSWTGHSPRPALVLAGALSWPGEWRPLLPPHDGPLHEAELQPLDPRESEAYLSQRLCPRPGMQLAMDRSLRRAIRATRGRIEELDKLAERLDAPVCRPLEVNSAFRGKALFWGLFVAMVLVLALVLRFMERGENRVTVVEPPAELAVITTEMPPGKTEPANPSPQVQDRQATAPAGTADPVGPERSPVPASLNKDGIANPVVASNSLPAKKPLQTESESNADDNTPNKPAIENSLPAPAGLSLLSERLQATLEWLTTAKASGYRIQLMTVGGSETSARALDAHLRKLVSQDIPLNQLWVYHARDVRRPEGYYGLLYGYYADRDAAAQAIERLPEALRVKRPLLRSLEGLRHETNLGTGS